MLQACLNGARRAREHPALPVTPTQLAADALAVRTAGADALHLHVKDDAGLDTLAAEPLAAVLEQVRAAVPGVPVGVTTGAWAAPDPQQRVAAVRSWAAMPDFASVNWHEEGAEDVAAALLDLGVGVEAGLWHAAAVRAWLSAPVREACFRVLVELPDGLDEAAAETQASGLLGMLTSAGVDPGAVLLHGEGSSCWPALRVAAARGIATRIGLEDTRLLPDGSPAPDNAALLRAALVVRDQAQG